MTAAMLETLQIRCTRCGGFVDVQAAASEEPIRCATCGTIYGWDGSILVWSDEAVADDYAEEFHAVLAAAEPRHFWFAGRNRLILATLRAALGDPRGRSVLDVGCGTGYVLAALERAGMRGCGMDMNLSALRFARRRTRGLLVRGLAREDTFGPQFDVAALCDVIEHTTDDVGVVRAVAQALKPGGLLLVTVPALPHLWSAVDTASGHKRRYTRAGLVRTMRRAGLRVRLARYFNALLYPAQLAQRHSLREHPAATPADRLALVRRAVAPPAEPLNRLLGLTARADHALTRLALPFGTSLIALGVRES